MEFKELNFGKLLGSHVGELLQEDSSVVEVENGDS